MVVVVVVIHAMDDPIEDNRRTPVSAGSHRGVLFILKTYGKRVKIQWHRPVCFKTSIRSINLEASLVDE